MCSDGWRYSDNEINGKCLDCDTLTVDGIAQEGCHYSPVICDICRNAPCDGSC